MLNSRALKHKHVTYFNITAVPDTRRILEAQGYRRYSDGVFVALPTLSAWSPGTRVHAVTSALRAGADLPVFEAELLFAHADYGCVSLTVSATDGRHPFVFAVRRKFAVPYAYLVYCRETAEFVRYAGPVGRFLARRGLLLTVVDANGPIHGLIGRYFEGASPKYFNGPNQPRLGDLAYSERVMFGV